ncbi:MAG: hypothetical protein J7M40_07435 [Planctomycetes bacterium]|nr:hypothetical protein [Planctomycetota bacterium]
MFGRISNTWGLMGDSWRILKQDKELLLFPLLSGICCIIVIASFAIPMFAGDSWMPPQAGEEGESATTGEQVAYYLKLFLFYFCNYLVIIFFNSAVVGCAAMRMNGQNPTLGDGFRICFARMPLIVGWALIAATVGLILRIIEDKNRKIGRLIAGLLGMAWTAVSFLVLPILVIEKKDPITALKESTIMLKRTWGEQLMCNFSFGLIFFLLFLPGIALAALGIFIGISTQNAVVAVACIAVAVIYFIALSLIQSALQVIFQTALYYYAKHQTAPAGFDTATLGGAMYRK